MAHQVREELKPLVEGHLRAFGEQYFISFPAEEIASHIELLVEARDTGLAVRVSVSGDLYERGGGMHAGSVRAILEHSRRVLRRN